MCPFPILDKRCHNLFKKVSQIHKAGFKSYKQVENQFLMDEIKIKLAGIPFYGNKGICLTPARPQQA